MRLIAKEGTDCFYIRGFVLYLVLESGTSDLFVLLIRVEYKGRVHYILYLPFLLLVPYIPYKVVRSISLVSIKNHYI
jgi:hypothetical protein